MAKKFRYFVVYKPFNVHTRFTPPSPGEACLKDWFDVPRDVYPVGRLDKDSEGLLLLTNDATVNRNLLDPVNGHWRTYWAQVEGAPDDAALQPLRESVAITLPTGPYTTLPARATVLDPQPDVPPRTPPIRVRKYIPDTWISLSLQEGKNRQVRKMTAAVGFPTLRLIRVAIGGYQLPVLEPGWIQEISLDQLLLSV